MTKEDKLKILDLSKAGFGYTKISNMLELPVNTVKTFLRRSKQESSGICLQCGRKTKWIKGKKKKSSALTNAEWRGGMLIEKAVTKKLFIKPLVCFAERNSPLIQHQNESIVQGGVLPLQEENKSDFLSYFTTMSMVKEMLSQGLISISEFMRIEEDMCKKYCINITSIFRINAG